MIPTIRQRITRALNRNGRVPVTAAVPIAPTVLDPTPTRGLIGVSGSEQGRYNEFWAVLEELDRPPDTKVRNARGPSIAANRNALAEVFLSTPSVEWLLYVDDDQILPPDTLTRLLSHNVDCVSALYLDRRYPFAPHIYDQPGNRRGHVVRMGLEASDHGLVKCMTTGAGALLVRRPVFATLAKPYWTLGQIDKEQWCDDTDFFNRIRAAGVQPYCDLDALVGHKMDLTVWPSRMAGEWMTRLESRGVDVQVRPMIRKPAAMPFAAGASR